MGLIQNILVSTDLLVPPTSLQVQGATNIFMVSKYISGKFLWYGESIFQGFNGKVLMNSYIFSIL